MLQRISIIIGSTLNDELHQKSIYLLTAVAVLFVLLLRGCFDNEVVINGRQLDGVEIGWRASLIAFHLIAGAGVVVALLLGMRVLQRDRSNGTLSAILSKPVHRLEYIIGKTVGVWILAYGLTFILHLTVYGIMLIKTGGRIGMFIPASFIVAINIFCAVTLVMLLSSVLPDIAAALCCAVVWLAGYVNDTMIVAAQNEFVKSMLQQVQPGEYHVALWRVFWPKITAVQYFAVGLIKESEVVFPGPLHPLLNVTLYAVIAFLLLMLRFSRSEIR